MEEYIGKCLDSLLIPELDAVEVLVINDGSKDRSSEIAHQYAEKYPESIKVIDKENGNYGSCINAALPIAKGKYVKVLDADDTFDTEAFSKFVRALPERDEDVLITDFIWLDGNGKIWKETSLFNHDAAYSNKIFTFQEIYPYISKIMFMHYITLRVDNLRKMNYHQTEGVSYTDNEWVFAPISLANTFAYINCGYLYRYLIGREGQTMDPTIFFSKFNDHFRGFEAHAIFYESYRVDGVRKKYLEGKIFQRLFSYYRFIFLNGTKKQREELGKLDFQLVSKYPKFKKLTDQIPYSPHHPYKAIKAFRKSGYSSDFRIGPIPKFVEKLINIGAGIKGKL